MYFLQQWLSLLEYVHGSYYKEPRLRVGASSICLRKGLKEQLPHQPHQPHTNQSSFPLVYILWDSDSMARKILKITAAQVTWPKYTAALDKSWYGSAGKASTCNAGDLGSIPRSGRSPGEGNGYPLQYSGLENPMNRKARWARVRGVAESRTRPSYQHFILLSRKYSSRRVWIYLAYSSDFCVFSWLGLLRHQNLP